ncbi:hypothetical protein HY491_00655 [Candidatus Woesearchaeota archaeon]|nr:hypothetical protein [Candidatus Woesearchaeota archaeon]
MAQAQHQAEQRSRKMKGLKERYQQRIEQELALPKQSAFQDITSRDYQQFKKEIMPKHLGWYERACTACEKVIRLKPDQVTAERMQQSMESIHLEMTPAGAVSFAVIAPLLLFIIGSLAGYVLFQSTFFIVFFLIAGASLVYPLMKLPEFLAESWRLKASNQMVLCIFYVVTYMRHTSNLENAIQFAAAHLAPPLSLDLKKVLWDFETGKYDSVKESLDHYLESWREWNMEFVEAFHLIESSLYESAEGARLGSLDKALDVILEETYEKMLHYAQNLKSPMTMLHMIGIILPVLGLVILPLMVSFMEEVQWYHIAMLYNVALPIGVYYLGKSILSKRPTGYGDTDISEMNPEVKKYRNIIIKIGNAEVQLSPRWIALLIGMVLAFIGLLPVIIHFVNPDFADFGIGDSDEASSCGRQFCFLDYHQSTAREGPRVGTVVGPYGIGATLLSLLIPLSIGLGIGIYYHFRSKNVMKIRRDVEQLENEFASGLFQLGNRLGDNLPAEIAFGKVAAIMQGSVSGRFFALVSSNISRLGMSVKEAIFNPQQGAVVSFPSNIIDSSMKVLLQSVKKGPRTAAQALTNIARYVREIHRVNERLKDLMEDVISSMRSQIAFLAPIIAGIVVGITSMVATIIGQLSAKMSGLAASSGQSPLGFATLFGEGIPSYYFQIIVGLYVVQIVYILTILVNGIENGSDSLNEKYLLGVNMVRSIVLYVLIAGAIILLFNFIAGQFLRFNAMGV